MRHIFREYDIRGVADRDLKDETVQGIGLGLSRMLHPAQPGSAPRIMVAKDCRLSSPRLFEALVHGLVTGGAEVTDVASVRRRCSTTPSTS
jgi:phosphomannomutase/phosphoglucomutase